MSWGFSAPIILGAAGAGILLFAAASPRGPDTARTLESKVDNLVTDWMSTLPRKTSQHEGQFWSVQRNLDGNGVSYGNLQWEGDRTHDRR